MYSFYRFKKNISVLNNFFFVDIKLNDHETHNTLFCRFLKATLLFAILLANSNTVNHIVYHRNVFKYHMIFLSYSSP